MSDQDVITHQVICLTVGVLLKKNKKKDFHVYGEKINCVCDLLSSCVAMTVETLCSAAVIKSFNALPFFRLLSVFVFALRYTHTYSESLAPSPFYMCDILEPAVVNDNL